MQAAAGRSSTMKLEIPADVNRLADVRAFVRSSSAALGAGPKAIGDMVQAVDECLTNVVVHGYAGQPGNVRVEVEGDGSDLVVRLRDQARPFDPTRVPQKAPLTEAGRLPWGGMGIHLARQLTDRLAYRHTRQGNELTLVKSCITGREETDADHQR